MLWRGLRLRIYANKVSPLGQSQSKWQLGRVN